MNFVCFICQNNFHFSQQSVTSSHSPSSAADRSMRSMKVVAPPQSEAETNALTHIDATVDRFDVVDVAAMPSQPYEDLTSPQSTVPNPSNPPSRVVSTFSYGESSSPERPALDSVAAAQYRSVQNLGSSPPHAQPSSPKSARTQYERVSASPGMSERGGSSQRETSLCTVVRQGDGVSNGGSVVPGGQRSVVSQQSQQQQHSQQQQSQLQQSQQQQSQLQQHLSQQQQQSQLQLHQSQQQQHQSQQQQQAPTSLATPSTRAPGSEYQRSQLTVISMNSAKSAASTAAAGRQARSSCAVCLLFTITNAFSLFRGHNTLFLTL